MSRKEIEYVSAERNSSHLVSPERSSLYPTTLDQHEHVRKPKVPVISLSVRYRSSNEVLSFFCIVQNWSLKGGIIITAHSPSLVVAPLPPPFRQPSPGLALLPQGQATEPEPSPEQYTVQGPPGAPAMTVSNVPAPMPAALNVPNWIR